MLIRRELMKRTPVYGKQGRRIISIPNGRWVLQFLGGSLGEKFADPWKNERNPTDFATAISQLKTFESQAA
jgi:hypothetical protein